METEGDWMALMTANSWESCQPREGPSDPRQGHEEESWGRLELELVGKKFSTLLSLERNHFKTLRKGGGTLMPVSIQPVC